MLAMTTATAADVRLRDYLDRIGAAPLISTATTPDLSTLRRIVAAHTRSIAFENLAPFTRREVRLDPDLLLRGALDALGYTTTGLAARVMWGRPADAPLTPRGHMLLRVDLPEGPHLVDVGFGGLTLTGVLALEPEVEQDTPHEPFRLQEVAGPAGPGYVMQALVGGEWRPLYRFDLTPQLPADYELTNWYLGHHPDSHFLSGIMVARPAADRRYALGGTSLAVHHLGGPTERRTLESPAEIRRALEEQFLLDTSGLPDLETALARLF
jgi:arylamine N-acetyltransferase